MTNPTGDDFAYPEQLRHDIDCGRTCDKVAFPDPAAVPLGTDEEAAGTPVSGRDAAMARRIETSRQHALRPERRPHAGPGRIALVLLALLVALLAAVMLLR
jgi:hypothetical protein